MPKNVTFSVNVPTELVEWYDETFPGLSRSWLVTQSLRRFKAKFDGQHYAPVVDAAIDSIYDDLQK